MISQHKPQEVPAQIDEGFVPVDRSDRNTLIYLRIVGVVVTLIALYQVAVQFLFLKDLASGIRDIDPSAAVSCAIILIVVIGSVVFWFEKTIGWMLVVVYLAESVLGTSYAAFTFWKFLDWGSEMIYVIIFDIVGVAVYSVLIWMLCTSGVRKRYLVTNRVMIISFGLAVLLVILYNVVLKY